MDLTDRRSRSASSARRMKIWHLALVVAYVAIAIVNIQDQRRNEPALIVLASTGFVIYAGIGIQGWRWARRTNLSLGGHGVFLLYSTGMALLFLLATHLYLMIESTCLSAKLV